MCSFDAKRIVDNLTIDIRSRKAAIFPTKEKTTEDLLREECADYFSEFAKKLDAAFKADAQAGE